MPAKYLQLLRDDKISNDEFNIEVKYFMLLPRFDNYSGLIRDIKNINLGKTNPKIWKNLTE